MDLPLEENRGRLTYWLFYAGRCVTSAYAEVLRAHCKERSKPYVVSPPQWGALSLLLVQDGMTIGTMSQKRGVDAPAATGIITRLEQTGLVERRHDREDRRVVKVYLTDEGRDISQTLVSVVEDFEQSMKQGMASGELDRFLGQLQQLIAHASEIGGGAGDRFSLLPKDVVPLRATPWTPFSTPRKREAMLKGKSNVNLVTLLDFVNLFFAGMLAGIEFVIHYGLRGPSEILDDHSPLQLRQALVMRLRVLVPAFFAPTALLGIALTVLSGGIPGFWFRCAAVLAVCIWILIRVVGTVPINSATADWQLSAPPKNWKELVNRAERFHSVGVWAAVLAFAFFLTAVALKLAVH